MRSAARLQRKVGMPGARRRGCGHLAMCLQCKRSGSQKPAGEVAGTLQHASSARSGCQVHTGEVAGTLQCDGSAGSACHVHTGGQARLQVLCSVFAAQGSDARCTQARL